MMTWERALSSRPVRLYAGDLPPRNGYDGWIGLSVKKGDERHIRHDITTEMPIPEASVDNYYAEDVFEHIKYESLPDVVEEIFRVLRPGGLFRLAVPDYGCDFLVNRSIKDGEGNIIKDPGGDMEVPGHVWFPRIDSVRGLLRDSPFATNGMIRFLHYYTMEGKPVMQPIDHSLGKVFRTPDFDRRVQSPPRPMSLVVDCFKGRNN